MSSQSCGDHPTPGLVGTVLENTLGNDPAPAYEAALGISEPETIEAVMAEADLGGCPCEDGAPPGCTKLFSDPRRLLKPLGSLYVADGGCGQFGEGIGSFGIESVGEGGRRMLPSLM